MYKLFALLIVSFLMTGCLKSKEVRLAESNIKNYVAAGFAKYRSSCEAEAFKYYPVSNYQHVIKGFKSTPQDCSRMTTSVGKSSCYAANTGASTLDRPDRYEMRDANLAARNQKIKDCSTSKLKEDEAFIDGLKRLKKKLELTKLNQ